MWKWLHPYANPEKTFHLTEKLTPWFGYLAMILLAVGMTWALLFVPPDYQQGNSFRIFYIHVPSAILSLSVYVAMAIIAFSALVWQLKLADASVAAIAPVGAALTAVALFTGAAWGKPTWGTWWVWDARLTSQLIQLFLYLGVIALHNAFEDKAQGSKAAGILAIVGVVNVPIIKYSVEWWNTLHQGQTVTQIGKPAMTMDMYLPFVVCLFGFVFLISWLICLRFKTELLERNATRPWVKDLVNQTEK
ncbi:heme ABC transporter permease [Thalassotalea sp. 1_MG-2023]|uniref:heme ABC transporter permease n=1 Tax=Thalassotalea sp. 1_MG-2023 TaxID=3062680 RepID=UPI0026E11750|nr:heme ABC transporter permease [Thalassotalea sp. 1_MG-2023]MDO6428703.1 heme ABC transporter permease [Thalassotalea sp. 1_MG-2023]